MTTSKMQSILFFTPYGEWRVHNQVDVTVAAALQARNCQIRFVTCDGLYQPCAITRGERDCVRCQKTMADTFAPYNFSSSSLGSMITLKDAWRADNWVAGLTDRELATACFEDLPIGEWALSTAMTNFRVSVVEQLLDPRIVPAHRRFLRDTLLTYWTIARVLEGENFEAVMLFNARFYPYRAAFEAARRRGTRILVHERGRIGNSFTFFEGENCLGLETARRLMDAWSEVALDEREITTIEGHFSERLLGQSTNWPTYNAVVQQFDPWALLDVPDNAELVGLFSSSTDEISQREGFGDAKRQFELIDNAAAAVDGTNIYLVVRHHPHIAGSANSQVELTAFYEAYRQTLKRNKNVRIVMPCDDLRSYALFPHLTAAIAPFSSIAMELVAFGIPTVVSEVSDAAFDERFTLTDWSTRGLKTAMDFITSPNAQLRAEDIRRFYRNAYSLLYRSSVQFKVIGIKDYFHAVSNFDTTDALLPGQDTTLDRICEHLLGGRPTYNYPGDSDRLPSDVEEDRFIKAKLDVFAKRRKALETPTAGACVEEAAVNSFAVIIDETTGGDVRSSIWKGLPNARTLSIKTISPQHLKGWLKSALVFVRSKKSNRDYVAWAFGIRRLLRRTAEDYVLVTNPRFQFHDTSIAVISEAVRSAAAAELPIIILTGWLRDPDEFLPLRLQPAKAPVDYWREVRARLSGTLRPQDILASVVVRRDWLIECLKIKETAGEFENALFDAAAPGPEKTEIAVAQPVFLLC
jgi:hypothetical protein